MAGKLGLAVCQNFAAEAQAALESAQLDDVLLVAFPGACGRPPTGWEQLAATLPSPDRCERVHVLGSACVAGLPDPPVDLAHCRVEKMEQCFYLLAQREMVDHYFKTGAYLITPGWLARWPQHIQRWGFDRETARSFFGESVKRLLLLDTGVDPASAAHLRDFAAFVDLPFEILPIGLDVLRLRLVQIAQEWRLEQQEQQARADTVAAYQQSAEYAVALDIVAHLARVQTEAETIENTLNLFAALFAPRQMAYLAIVNGQPERLYCRPQPCADADVWKRSLTAAPETNVWADSAAGFVLRIDYQGETVGVLEIRDVAFPEYKQRYLNLALTIAQVCGLAIANARTLQHTRQAQAEIARLAGVIEQATESIVITDPEGRILYVNPFFERLTGYTAQEATGQNPRILKSGYQDETFYKELWDTLAAGQTWSGVFVNKRKDGSLYHEEAIIFPIQGARGEITHYAAVKRDITERVHIEAERERLLAAEREQRLLAETLIGVALSLTSQTRPEVVLDQVLRQVQRLVPVSAVNIALLQHDSLRVVRSQGYTVRNGQSPITDEAQPLADSWVDAQAVRSRQPQIVNDTQQEAHWVVRAKTAWIRSYLALPICLHEQVLGLLRLDGERVGQFSVQDARRLEPLAAAAAIAIERARQVEHLKQEVAARTAEIVAEKEKSETILRYIGDAISMTDREGKIRYVNPAFTALTGYAAHKVLGQSIHFLIGDQLPEVERHRMRQALVHGEVWQGEVTARRKDGRTYDAALVIAPIFDAAGSLAGHVSSHHDISRFKELERARQRFITNVSHELRTPATNLKLYTRLLKQGGSPEKISYYLQVLEAQSERLIHLIQDILELIELDSGQCITNRTTVLIPTLIEDLVEHYQWRIESSGLTLTTTAYAPDLPATVGDADRLAQAMIEVIDNAFTFTPTGGQVTLETAVAEDGEGQWVTIAVHDTGPGIDLLEQEHIFERFYRGRLAESGHVPGAGLGLSIAHEIVGAHSGRLTVASPATFVAPGVDREKNPGSTFTFWLRPSD
jgi:PAS domain S-box-containing protein